MADEPPVRVGRFEWERLMLMSVPHPQNFKVLPLGVFMSVDGSRVRPGNAGLAMFGPHEKTWAKLLRWAVDEGWLLLVQRGGARKGPGGTTVRRASVYAASVPQHVWERRMEILGAPPFKAPGFEGSASETPDSLKGAREDSSESLKGAPKDSDPGPDSLKGATTAPFNGPDPSLKGAPKDSLPDSLKGAIGVFEGSVPVFEGSVPVFEGSAQTLPHHVVPSRSNSSSTSTTSRAEVSSITLGRETEGGGGGDSFPSDTSTATAQTLVASLDYRGDPPGAAKRQQIVTLVAAALSVGWADSDLKTYLDLRGARVSSAVGVYAHRLSAEQLPDAQTYREAQQQTLTGPDANVAGWMALANGDGGMWGRAMDRAQDRMDQTPSKTDARVRQAVESGRRLKAQHDAGQRRGGYRLKNPNAVWEQIAEAEKNGQRPPGSDKVPPCNHVDCDPITRHRESRDEKDLKVYTPCPKCHPALKF